MEHRAPVKASIVVNDLLVAGVIANTLSQVAAYGCEVQHTLSQEDAEICFYDSEEVPVCAHTAIVYIRVINRRAISHRVESTPNLGVSNYLKGEVVDDEIRPSVLLPWCLLAREVRDKQASKPFAAEFFARGAHEIRTPLMAILAHVESLKDPSLDYETQLQVVSEIRASGKYLLELIDEVLLFSRIEVGRVDLHLEPIDIRQICSELQPLLEKRAAERGNQFIVEFAYPLPKQFSCDPLRLRQILLNLVGNAIKFTEHGSVALVVSYFESSGTVGLDVIDTGVGIPGEELDRIFHPFHQGGRTVEKKFGGSGLGLAVTKGILQALGGEISVRSTPGHGSIFSVTLPGTPLHGELVVSGGMDQEPLFRKVERSANDVRLSGRVLIADDTPATRELLEGLFRFAGAQVCAVKDGACALEQGAREKYDLIIMDAEMPVVNGYEAMEQLRARGVTVPIIAVTAHLHREELQKCIASGANQFVSKASSMDEILFAAEQFIGVVSENSVYEDLLSTDSPQAHAVMTRAKLKYLDRFERSMEPLKEAVRGKKWGRVNKILHPLSSAKMFGFTHVTEELRSIAMVLHRLLQNEKEAIGQIEQLALLERPLQEARRRIENELEELIAKDEVIRGG